VARYWSINTAATAVPLSAHPSPLVITTKLATSILGGPLFGRGVLPAQYCPCDLDPGIFWTILQHCEIGYFPHSSHTYGKTDRILVLGRSADLSQCLSLGY